MSNHTAFSPVDAIDLDKWAGWIPYLRSFGIFMTSPLETET